MSSIQCESNQSGIPKASQEHFLVSKTNSREERGKMHVAMRAFLK